MNSSSDISYHGGGGHPAAAYELPDPGAYAHAGAPMVEGGSGAPPGRRIPWLAGLVWGVVTGFSNFFFATPQWTMGAGMLLAAALLMIHFRSARPLFASITDFAGAMMIFHGFVACVSTIANGPHLLTMRYLMIVLAFSLLLAVRGAGMPAVDALRRGLTWACFFVVAVHLPALSGAVGAFSNPFFRLNVFLNPNALAFIGVIGAISIGEYVLSRLRDGRRGWTTWALVAALVVCVLVVISTKSRTAAIVFLAAGFALLALRVRLWAAAAFVLFGVPAILVAWTLIVGVGETISTVYMLGPGGRDIGTMTGRLENWMLSLDVLFWPSPVLGSGPGSSGLIGVVHNALIFNLCEVGILGTLPLLVVMVMAGVNALRHWREPHVHFAIALFVAGTLEAIPEALLFSIGNPAGLMFILATVVLLRPPPAPLAAASVAGGGAGYGYDDAAVAYVDPYTGEYIGTDGLPIPRHAAHYDDDDGHDGGVTGRGGY